MFFVDVCHITSWTFEVTRFWRSLKRWFIEWWHIFATWFFWSTAFIFVEDIFLFFFQILCLNFSLVFNISFFITVCNGFILTAFGFTHLIGFVGDFSSKVRQTGTSNHGTSDCHGFTTSGSFFGFSLFHSRRGTTTSTEASTSASTTTAEEATTTSMIVTCKGTFPCGEAFRDTTWNTGHEFTPCGNRCFNQLRKHHHPNNGHDERRNPCNGTLQHSTDDRDISDTSQHITGNFIQCFHGIT